MTILNFAAETVFESNTTSGNVSLTRTQLQSLIDENYSTGGIFLNGDDILALDVDLGNRVAVQDLRYYFSSAAAPSTVASGISFYYRDYTTDPWTELTTTHAGSYYTTTSGNFFPHQIRVVHTISGTGVSGTLYEYEVNSNDDIVDFGEDGSLTEKNLQNTPFGTSSPYTIPIYNDGDQSATAYIYIGNTDTDADEMLRISDAQNGTYINVDDGKLIDGNINGLDWGQGSHNNTTVDNNKLVLQTGQIYGTYTTPIFKNTDPTYWRVKAEIPENTQIATTSGVPTSTIEIRSSDITPDIGNFHRVTWFARDPSNDNRLYLVTVDYNGNEVWTYDTGNYYFQYTGSTAEGMQGWCQASNKFYPTGPNSSSRYHFICWWFNDNSPSVGYVFGRYLDVNGNVVRSRTIHNLGYTSNYYRPTNAIINRNNSVYCCYRGFGSQDDRLEVYDSYLNTISSISFSGDQSTLYSLCLADDEEDIWIIKEDENAVYRYNPNLIQQNLIENDDFGNLNGICEDGSGGIFIGDTGSSARKIWHYDANGSLIKEIDVTAYMTAIHRMRPDYYGGVWALDTASDRLVRFANNGTYIGQTNLSNPTALDSTHAGCWALSESEEKLYFVDFDMVHQTTIDTTTWGGSSPYSTAYDSRDGANWRGALALNIDIDGYIDSDRVTGDSHWGSSGDLEWSEVSKDNNFVHHKNYHQARITLRSDGSDTPEVEKVALPPTVGLSNIPAQGYKNAYLKTVVASGTLRQRQDGKIRAWFSLEE